MCQGTLLSVINAHFAFLSTCDTLAVVIQVEEYVQRIKAARPAVYQLFTKLAETNPRIISDDLNIDPFDTIAQSVFYLPWWVSLLLCAAAKDALHCSALFNFKQVGHKKHLGLCCNNSL